jgi:hypothetical protein
MKDTITIIILIIALAFTVWLVQANVERLRAYDDCYMAKYSNWSTDCELGGYK